MNERIRAGLQSGIFLVYITVGLALLPALFALATLLRHVDADAQQTTANLAVIAKTGTVLTKSLNDQRRLLNVESERVAELTQETRANLNCRPGITLGKGADAIHCRTLGVLPATADAIDPIAPLIRNTDRNLNGDRGALVELQNLLRQTTADEATIIHDASGLIQSGTVSVGDLQDVLKALTALETNGDLKQSLTNMNLATADFAGILHDLRNPKKPGPFLRALNILVFLLRSGAMLGQASQIAQ